MYTTEMEKEDKVRVCSTYVCTYRITHYKIYEGGDVFMCSLKR